MAKRCPVDAEWRRLQYHVFDAVLPGVPFAQRYARLQALLPATGPVRLVRNEVVTSRADLRRRLDDICRGGGEGLMLRTADGPYEPRRSWHLLKMKRFNDAEAVVVGRSLRQTGSLARLFVQWLDTGVEFRLGTGFTNHQRSHHARLLPNGAVVKVRFQERLPSGRPRIPVFVGVCDTAHRIH